jgi:hypothetical protein
MKDIFVNGKKVWMSTHAIIQARKRKVAFPDQVYEVISTGKIRRFGKNQLKFVKKSDQRSIVCVGVDVGHAIIIKTIERGN